MLIPQKIATVSLKCKKTWMTVDIHELGDMEALPVAGGQYLSRFCDYKLDNGPIEYLRVGYTPSGVPFTDEQLELVKSWMPRAGLMRLIDVVGGRLTPHPENHVFVQPSQLDLDPQKNDMRIFRERCRYDVLRVINDKLLHPSGQLRIALAEIMSSQLVTRLYSKDDLMSAMRYWSQEKILIHGTLGPTYTIDELRDDDITSLVGEYDWEECALQHDDPEKKYDVFICHASEDKESFVRSLANALQQAGLRVWYDEFTLGLGDRLRRSIDKGLVDSRYGIVVLSTAFFSKEWPQYELDGLAQQEVAGAKVILPVWHDIVREDVMKYSPSLADRIAAKSNLPMRELVASILEVINPST